MPNDARPETSGASTPIAAFNRRRVRVWDMESNHKCVGCGAIDEEVWPVYLGNRPGGHGKVEFFLCPDCMMDLAIQMPLKP